MCSQYLQKLISHVFRVIANAYFCVVVNYVIPHFNRRQFLKQISFECLQTSIHHTAVSMKNTDFCNTMPLFAGLLLGLLFVPENGGSMMLGNVIRLY
jgi:hypothetical protein